MQYIEEITFTSLKYYSRQHSDVIRSNSVFNCPFPNTLKVSAYMQSLKIWPQFIHSWNLLEGEDTHVTLAHKICTQDLDTVI